MSLITGNKVKKTHKPKYCEKEKDQSKQKNDLMWPYVQGAEVPEI
jgi:hypothetical protein